MTDVDDPFGEDFGSLEDFLKGLKPGEHRPLSGILRYRQGGDARHWGSGGGQKYIPGSWQMLTGAVLWEGAAATSGVKNFNFPTSFVYLPVLLVTPVFTWPLMQEISYLAAHVDGGAAEIWWWSPSNLTEAMFNWLALGPVGTV